jgi:hypothetical protein
MVVDETKKAAASRLLFGSCNSQHYYEYGAAEAVKKQGGGRHAEPPVWKTVQSRNAAAFVWAGDAVYGDKPTDPEEPVVAYPERLRSLYEGQLQVDSYQSIGMPVLGTLDDHDYGINNGDRTYQHRLQSGQLFVEFLKNSSDYHDFEILTDRVGRGKGVYYAKLFDFERPKGSELLSDEEAGLEPGTKGSAAVARSKRTVAVFMLDNRTQKDPWIKTFPQRLFPDPDGDFLGEDQWTWLQQSLSRSPAAVNIVVQGLQVHADRFFDGSLVENWSRFPSAQQRLYKTILDSSVKAPILVSGDVHMAELYLKNCNKGPAKRPLLEVTTSGLTHSWCTNFYPNPKSATVSYLKASSWTRASLCYGMHLAHIFWTDVINVDADRIEGGAKAGRQYTLDLNFAEFEFDWEKETVITRIMSTTPNRPPLLSLPWSFADLSGADNPMQDMATGDEWICLDQNGGLSFPWKAAGVVVPMSTAFLMSMMQLVLPVILTLLFLKKTRSTSMGFVVLVGDRSKRGCSSNSK